MKNQSPKITTGAGGHKDLLAELLREQERLKMERATLRAAPRLEAIAKARLGMSAPSASQLVSLRIGNPQKEALAAVTLPRAAAR